MIVSRVSPVLKSLGAGRFEGLAWSFAATPDTQGDLLLPSALAVAAKSAPWPLLVEHSGDPVGEIDTAEVGADGMNVAGRIDTASSAYQRMKVGELGGLSIAFTGQAEASGPVRVFSSIQMVEVSACRVPVNTGSRVRAVKSWAELESEVELQALLKTTGMPGRLAQKCASAAWPILQKHNQTETEPDAALMAALRKFATR